MKRMLLGLGVLIICSGCSDSSTGVKDKPEKEEKSYKEVKFIPTEIGRYWIIEGFSESDTSYISKDTTINDSQFYVIKDVDLGMKQYFAYSDSGMVLGRVRNESFTDQVFYRYPNESNKFEDNSYPQYERNSNDEDFNVYTYPTSDSLITTDLGEFKTYVFFNRVERKSDGSLNNRYEYYFKEGIGFVREKRQPEGFSASTYDLIETGNISELPNFPTNE